MIKTPGCRVSPTKVMAVLHSIDPVGQCIAFGMDDASLDQVIRVFATASDGGAVLELAALLTTARQQIQAYRASAGVEPIAGALLRNPNGKIERTLLVTPSAEHHAGSTE